MRIALEVWSSDFAKVRATCIRSEQLGFDAFYYGESPHELNLECWSTLAALAETTDTIRLGPVITNSLPDYRSTALLIKQAAAIDVISGGRLDFRTGVGADHQFGQAWWEPFGIEYPRYDKRLADLNATLDLVEAELPELPMTIAATGQRAMNLAARRAQVWETSFCTPEEFARRHQVMQGFEADRVVSRSLEVDGFMSTTKAGVERLFEQVRVDRGDAENLDPIFERAVAGRPDQVAAQLASLSDAGVDQVVVALHDPHDPDALEALAQAARLLRQQTESQSRTRQHPG